MGARPERSQGHGEEGTQEVRQFPPYVTPPARNGSRPVLPTCAPSIVLEVAIDPGSCGCKSCFGACAPFHVSCGFRLCFTHRRFPYLSFCLKSSCSPPLGPSGSGPSASALASPPTRARAPAPSATAGGTDAKRSLTPCVCPECPPRLCLRGLGAPYERGQVTGPSQLRVPGPSPFITGYAEGRPRLPRPLGKEPGVNPRTVHVWGARAWRASRNPRIKGRS